MRAVHGGCWVTTEVFQDPERFAFRLKTVFRPPSVGTIKHRHDLPRAPASSEFFLARILPCVRHRPSLTSFQPPERNLRPTNSNRQSRKAPLGVTVVPLHDTSREHPPVAWKSQFQTTFRPWRSSHLRRFAPLPTSQAYFIPQPCSGFSLQGFDLQCRAVPSHPQPVPSCRSQRHPLAETNELCQLTPPVAETTPEESASSSGLCSLHRV